MMSKKYIGVNERAYEWSSATHAPAPWPKRNKLKINVQDILHKERPKEFCIYIDPVKNIGHVDWLTQESSYPSDKFNKEIIRAFKANDFHGKIEVRYGIRSDGLTEFYELEA